MRSAREAIRGLIANERNLQRWVEHPSSAIVHHEAECCEEARLWFLAYARSMEINSLSQFEIKAPTWLNQLFTWGPMEWPISWCQIIKEQVIDCGAFAALSREVFKAQGHDVHPAQSLLSYNDACTRHWKELWDSGLEHERRKKKKRRGEFFPWIGDQVVYHEICALELPDGSARLYDSTWGNWYEPFPRAGFGALLAVRTECPRLLRWGDKTMSCGEWIDL